MPNSRIPRTISEFNTYITNANTYMLAGTPTNWNRLGWTATEIAQWTGFVTAWTPLFAKYSDKKASRTTAIKDQLLLIIKQCLALDKSNHLLDRIASSLSVTILDMETFHIKKGVLQDSTHTTPHTAISDTVIVSLHPLGGGTIEIKCRTSHDSNRPSIAESADCVQYLYMVGTTPPASTNDAGLRGVSSTHASFTLSLETGSSGKTLYIYFRWYNTKHPALAGPWSSLQTVLVL